MSNTTAIKWTEATFNPWWGCERVSPACRHCYAETFAVTRLGLPLWGSSSARRFFGPGHWREPLKLEKKAIERDRPILVFCASMADVFEDRPDLELERGRLFDLITRTPHLIWQLLTKRPENVAGMVPSSWLRIHHVEEWGGRAITKVSDWPRNVWLGTTVEDQERAELRLPVLESIPAPVRFVSAEPLLGELDLSRWLRLEWMDALRPPGAPLSFRGEGGWGLEMFAALGGRRSSIDWIIVGGESGNGFRPLNLDFARDVRDQARAAEIPFFFKQVGGRTAHAGGDELDVETIREFPPEARR